MTTPRYAVYFAPHPESALWHFGSRVLGYDAYTGTDLDQPTLDGLTPFDMVEVTEDPRRYGFHGTLKAPFRLAEGRSADELLNACGDFARRHHELILSRLVAQALGPFIALVPGERSPALHALAAAAVEHFEPFRAPLTPEEAARRRPERLSERQRANLDRWGYPYVFEDFQFHMTLTGAIEDERVRHNLLIAAEEAYAEIAEEPVPIDAIGLFEQPAPDRRFVILERFPLAP